jgi:hypothetical protein
LWKSLVPSGAARHTMAGIIATNLCNSASDSFVASNVRDSLSPCGVITGRSIGTLEIAIGGVGLLSV